jgi:hypothetical protein
VRQLPPTYKEILGISEETEIALENFANSDPQLIQYLLLMPDPAQAAFEMYRSLLSQIENLPSDAHNDGLILALARSFVSMRELMRTQEEN